MAISKIKENSLDSTAVSSAKLGADAVDATKIADDAVSGEHIDVSAVTDHSELTLSDLATTDVLLIYDASANALKKITKGNLIAAQPTVTSVTPTNALSGDGTGNYSFVIAGTGYESSTVKFIGNDGTEYNASSTTTDSSTQVTAVVAKSTLPSTNEPYDVKVTNSNSLTITSSDAFNIDAQPAYVTSAGSLGTVLDSTRGSASFTIEASDPESGAVTFHVVTGALPAGASLNSSTGVISGFNAVGSNTTTSFTIEARDTASNATERDFSITVNAPTAQSFTSSGTFSVPSGVTAVNVLVVAGGGGSGYDAGGGGGAGGLIYRPGFTVSPGGTVSVTVGDGGNSTGSGVGGPNGNNGQDSVFGTLTAKGGGAGGSKRNTGSVGGSGGGSGHNNPGSGEPGASANQPTQPGESGNYGFGNPGGASTQNLAGGGGGAGAAGEAGSVYSHGGIGKAYTIADGTTSVFYAGGGGGTRFAGTSGQGSGGQGGGGQGGYGPSGTTNPTPGTANRGGGGGGGNPQGGQGGKGIVIVAY